MSRYRRIAEPLRRPLAAVTFLSGVYMIVEAICLDRGVDAYMIAVPVIGGSVVSWWVPSGRRAHPPSESTLQWARKHRREGG
jgi:hypothetical protein